MSFRIIIAGSRDFQNYAALVDWCDEIIASVDFELKQSDIEIVSGTARGADQLGERYAQERGYSLKKFPADWDKYGKAAGYKRNVEMAEYSNYLIAFWDGKSRGTKHMIDICRERKISYCVYRIDQN